MSNERVNESKKLRCIPVRYVGEEVISFAQNLEDVLMFRALGGKRNGFYVDVGAGSPGWDSVTHWFSRIGWTGINIEPNPILFCDIPSQRSRDINLNVGIHPTQGTMTFYQVLQNEIGHGWGLSSFNPEAKEIAQRLGFTVNPIDVPVEPLTPILDEHAKRTIDFLKIDVEGLEREVILSCDFAKHRPRILCIESIKPEHGIPNFENWEPILVDSGYIFAAFDGINNYYVRREDDSLLSQFLAPVNVHDRHRKGAAGDLAIS